MAAREKSEAGQLWRRPAADEGASWRDSPVTAPPWPVSEPLYMRDSDICREEAFRTSVAATGRELRTRDAPLRQVLELEGLGKVLVRGQDASSEQELG